MSMIPKYTLGVTAAAVIIGAISYWVYPKWIVIPKARQPILAIMKDPGSAQFRDEHIGQGGAVCGEVNVKNSMGGYVGFKKYIAAGSDGSYVEGHEPLNGWSAADVTRRKDLEAKIFTRFVDRRKEFPGLEAPIGQDLEDLASKEFFEYKWREICEPGVAM